MMARTTPVACSAAHIMGGLESGSFFWRVGRSGVRRSRAQQAGHMRQITWDIERPDICIKVSHIFYHEVVCIVSPG